MICKITPERRAADAAWLSELVAASGIKPQQVEGFTDVKPMPPRSKRIDPDTVLKRRRTGISRTERLWLRKITEGL